MIGAKLLPKSHAHEEPHEQTIEGKCSVRNFCRNRMRTKKESSDESVKVICWLPQSGESSGVSVKVIRWLSGREGLRESSGKSSNESVKVIGLLASP